MLNEKTSKKPIIFFLINTIVAIPITIFSIIFLVKCIREYFPQIKNNIISDINKISNLFKNNRNNGSF
jgi:hypothetical protein